MNTKQLDQKYIMSTYSRHEPVIDRAKGCVLYGEDGKEAKAREHRHMTMYEAADLAKRAQPREMWLTHYSPSLTRPDEFMDKVKKIFPRAKAARDGWTRELMFEEESGEKQE